MVEFDKFNESHSTNFVSIYGTSRHIGDQLQRAFLKCRVSHIMYLKELFCHKYAIFGTVINIHPAR
jgi:hypothetical protein